MTEHLDRQLPAAVLALWAPRVEDEVLQKIVDELVPRPGLARFGRHRLVCWPSAREPAIFDSAIHTGLRIADGLRQRVERSIAKELRVLILPARGMVRNQDAWVEGDPVVQALCDQPELLLEPGIHLTSRASHSLEAGWFLGEEVFYDSPAGPVVPLKRLAEASYRTARRRNTRVLRRQTEFVGRARLLEEVQSALGEGSFRITGPLGCGKSRLLWETTKDHDGTVVWCAPFLGGTLGLSLAEELWSQLSRETPVAAYELTDHPTERRLRAEARVETWLADQRKADHPFIIVLDDLDRAPQEDLAWLDRILAEVEGSVKIVLLARPGVDWPEQCASLPEIEIGPVKDSTSRAIVEQLSDGLEMPREVLDRVLEASAGNLFALEEGLHELTHRGSISQIYGSFFFGGSSTTRYAPSARWICHVHAEMERLGSTIPLLALAALDRPVPLEVLEAVGGLFSARPDSGWAPQLGLAGWLETAQSPWGKGLDFACRAVAEGLSATLTRSSRDRLRSEVGERLIDRCTDPGSSWDLYGALAGTEVGSRLLLTILGPVLSKVPREQAFAAIQRELELLRESGGDDSVELKLLWSLLPIAKRMGRLGSLGVELERAVELARNEPEMLIALQALRARLARGEHRFSDAEAYLGEALQLAVRGGSRRTNLLALELSALLVQQKRYEEARKVLEQLLREAPNAPTQTATCKYRLAEIARLQLRYEDAKELHEEALEARRELGLVLLVGSSLCGLAETCLLLGDYPQSLQYFREAHDLFIENDEPTQEGAALAGIGRVLSHLGQFAEASQPLKRAQERLKGRDMILDEALSCLHLAENRLDLRQIDAAEELALEAKFKIDLSEDLGAMADCDLILGRIRFRQKRYEDALEHFETALEGHRNSQSEAEVADDLSRILEVELARGELERVEVIALDLDIHLRALAYPCRRELIELRLFNALERLQEWGFEAPVDPSTVIKRAYEHLLRKTSYLEQAQRHRFLLEVPENQAIVEAATRRDIPLPNH